MWTRAIKKYCYIFAKMAKTIIMKIDIIFWQEHRVTECLNTVSGSKVWSTIWKTIANTKLNILSAYSVIHVPSDKYKNDYGYAIYSSSKLEEYKTSSRIECKGNCYYIPIMEYNTAIKMNGHLQLQTRLLSETQRRI
jgi:hypothetical protein